MHITKLTLKNFRCFEDRTLDFNGKFIVIQGNNGTGKTSLLEALHYACYMRSFRTHLAPELLQGTSPHAFIHVDVQTDTDENHSIQVGISPTGKRVRLDNHTIKSYKDLLTFYRVVSMTEDDLELVKGAPELRRAFLSQSLFLRSADSALSLKNSRRILNNRNSLLFKSKTYKTPLYEDFLVWSRQLWEVTKEQQEARTQFLHELQQEVNRLLSTTFVDQGLTVAFEYQPRNFFSSTDFNQFWSQYEASVLPEEQATGRSQFGIHLDDFVIHYQNKNAKSFASRGQQKLLLFLIKIAQFNLINHGVDERGCLFLDDFLTDFDHIRLERCIALLNTMNVQIFVTCPINSDPYFATAVDMQKIELR